MLGLENPVHILFLLAILLMVFGAKRLPEMGRGLGEGLRGFKDAVSGHHPIADLTAAPTTTVAAPIVATPATVAALPLEAAVPSAAPAGSTAGTTTQQAA